MCTSASEYLTAVLSHQPLPLALPSSHPLPPQDQAERCVGTLLDLIQTKVNYVVQEAIVVIKDIFRKYPNKYEGIISTLCDNLDSLDEPEARCGEWA